MGSPSSTRGLTTSRTRSTERSSRSRSVLMSSMTPSTTCLPTTKQPSHCSSQHSHPVLWKIIASSSFHEYRNHVTLSYSIIYKILYHKVHLKINSEPES